MGWGKSIATLHTGNLWRAQKRTYIRNRWALENSLLSIKISQCFQATVEMTADSPAAMNMSQTSRDPEYYPYLLEEIRAGLTMTPWRFKGKDEQTSTWLFLCASEVRFCNSCLQFGMTLCYECIRFCDLCCWVSAQGLLSPSCGWDTADGQCTMQGLGMVSPQMDTLSCTSWIKYVIMGSTEHSAIPPKCASALSLLWCHAEFENRFITETRLAWQTH